MQSANNGRGYYDMGAGNSVASPHAKELEGYLENAYHRNNHDSFSSDATTQVEQQQQQQHITTVAHVGFSDALIAQKPSPWTKTMFKLYFFLFVAFLNSCINGYDGSLMGGINAMTYYQK